jgi:hypothetical protein
MTDQIHSQNLVPFKKRRGPYHIPGMTGENEEHALDVDHDLSREEERYIRHYLGYADSLLKHAPDETAALQSDDSSSETVASAESSLEDASVQNTATTEIPSSESEDSAEPESNNKAA